MTERFDPFQIFINCREYKLVVLFIQKMVYRYKVIQEPHISHIQLKERTYTVKLSIAKLHYLNKWCDLLDLRRLIIGEKLSGSGS